MEQALLRLEQERVPQHWDLNQERVTAAVAALAHALREVLTTADDGGQARPVEDTSSDSVVTAYSLLELCQTHSSSSSMPLSHFQLARAIWSASQLQDEAQQQAALFDALGESGMELLFQVATQLPEISCIPERDFIELEQRESGGSRMTTSVHVDPEEAHRQQLLREARNAAEVAAIAQAEVGSLDLQASSSTTHRVMRKSEIQAQKAAQKAVKRAAAAWKAAKDAGAIVDESEFLSVDTTGNTLGAGGLMGQSREQIWDLQHSLKPTGTREYHEQQGLPKGTEREYYEGYEKVTIPAPIRDESKLPKRLRVADIMDAECARAFDGTESLNPMQSQVFETAFHRRDNMLVCAPTGAGKTNVAMLAVAAHFRDVGLILSTNKAGLLETGRKVVYIAPMKALAQEVVEKFQSKLKPLHLIVRELTGDMQLTRAEAESAHVIVTTPEKWDVVTRKSGNDENSLGNQCGLLIIDEVHLLADERGAVIESVVARLHRLVESRQRQVRIVALSATLPNYQDVGVFLQVPQRALFFFGAEHRPVPLQQHFIGITVQTRDRFVRENKMNDVCYEAVVDSLRRGNQVMVFVHSRKGTGDTATALADRATKSGQLENLFVTQGKENPAGEANSRYVDRVKKSRNHEVGNHFQNGMGIHHAGMLRGDRKLTERMFAEGAINVLCCTATLAWGVNLPAHTVIVKGTEVYNPEKGGNVDLSILDVQQIFGRAGRPDFVSDYGEATLITTNDALARYLDKLVRAVPIESNFIKQLADHLNAEVVGGTVTNIQEAATWLTYTYLHVRMLRNPLAYGISADQKADDPMLRGRSRELVHEAAKLLDSNQMLRYSVETGNLGVTDLGRVAAHFYIQAQSVATFNDKLGNYESLSDAALCHLICCATEFENVRIRQEELDEVDSLAKTCPLPVKIPVHDPSDKSYVLLQAFISRERVKSFTLISDTNYIASNAGRVARAMFEMCLKQNMGDRALKLLRIAKSADKRFWWFQTPLRHFDSELKSNVFAALESRRIGSEKGYDAFEAAVSLLDLDPREVGQLCHWSKGGNKVQRFIRMLPRVDMVCNVRPVTSSVLKFHITLRPIFEWQNRWHGGAEAFWIWVEDGESNRIYHSEFIIFSRRTHPETITLDLAIPAFEPLPKQNFIRVVSDSWVGVEMLLPVSFRDVILPTKKTPFTDLIDLTPLPITALQEEKYERLYATKFEAFNPIQTMLFHVLYHSDSPILLGAPTGSGKTVVAELALLRMKRVHPRGICVYIAPLKSLARERLKEWTSRLGGNPLRWKVLELSGDTHHDQKALSSADVLVCTPEKYDLISRGWRGSDSPIASSNASNGRAFIKRVRLLVIDEIHLLGEERGAVLEAIVSRTRFISKHLETARQSSGASHHDVVRIVGLSTALANPYDLGDWIGIEGKLHGAKSLPGLYNFRPSVRPIPMEVHMQGFAGRHYCPRMATMNKPCYAAIKEHSPDKPTLIFVASRRQTRLTALDIISYAAAEENPRSFLGCGEDYIEAVAERVHDEALRHVISFGIGLHHAGLSTSDRETVEGLYVSGKIKVLVATATLAWGVNLPAHFVIVKGTEYFDGKTSRYVDYPLTDVLQMIGRAGRPGFDDSGVALVMLAEDKKNFYKKFLYMPFPVESCLSERMCENLNAEIAIGTIKSILDGVGYLKWTFFARRLKANPSYYGADSGVDEDVDRFLLDVVKATTEKLSEQGCVEVQVDGDDENKTLCPTLLGRTATDYYLQHCTPKQMLLGVKEARKLIMKCIEEEGEAESAYTSDHGLVALNRSARTDEVSLAWILYALASTHEFDELPVRHNEEYLNAEMSENLIWGADTSTLLTNGNLGVATYQNMDVMADPHTKCFLLLQAYLERATLPISDYFNDMKSVLDQFPRLLAAMQFIAMGETTTAGSFEVICQFSRVRQIYATRSMVEESPLLQVHGFSTDAVRNWTKPAPLWELRRMNRDRLLGLMKGLNVGRNTDPNQLVDAIHGVPLCVVDSVTVSHTLDKGSDQSVGILKLSLSVENTGKGSPNKSRQTHRDGGHNGRPMTLALVVGTFNRRVLLSHKTLNIPKRGTVYKKDVELSFDWNSANADGGEGDGTMVLRLLHEDIRGLDSEMKVSLR